MSKSDYEMLVQAHVEGKLMDSLDRRQAIRENNQMWGRVVTALIVIILLLLIFW